MAAGGPLTWRVWQEAANCSTSAFGGRMQRSAGARSCRTAPARPGATQRLAATRAIATAKAVSPPSLPHPQTAATAISAVAACAHGRERHDGRLDAPRRGDPHDARDDRGPRENGCVAASHPHRDPRPAEWRPPSARCLGRGRAKHAVPGRLHRRAILEESRGHGQSDEPRQRDLHRGGGMFRRERKPNRHGGQCRNHRRQPREPPGRTAHRERPTFDGQASCAGREGPAALPMASRS